VAEMAAVGLEKTKPTKIGEFCFILHSLEPGIKLKFILYQKNQLFNSSGWFFA
jgi:hypothetical protein